MTRLNECEVGSFVSMVEGMDEETRVTTYLLLPGEPVWQLGYIPVWRVSCTQGIKGQKARYHWQAGKRLIRSEAHPLTQVVRGVERLFVPSEWGKRDGWG